MRCMLRAPEATVRKTVSRVTPIRSGDSVTVINEEGRKAKQGGTTILSPLLMQDASTGDFLFSDDARHDLLLARKGAGK